MCRGFLLPYSGVFTNRQFGCKTKPHSVFCAYPTCIKLKTEFAQKTCFIVFRKPSPMAMVPKEGN